MVNNKLRRIIRWASVCYSRTRMSNIQPVALIWPMEQSHLSHGAPKRARNLWVGLAAKYWGTKAHWGCVLVGGGGRVGGDLLYLL